jgi:MFS family permease
VTTQRLGHRRAFYAIGFADYAVDFHVLIVAPLLVVDRTGSAAALFLVAASNWLSETAFEIPTGYLADRFGRALSTASSFAVRGIGLLVIATSHSTL